MKKLSLVVIVMAIFALGYVGIASAQDVEGMRYKMTSTGSCLHSTAGFNLSEDGLTYTPTIDAHSKVWGATTMTEATWDFNTDETVLMSGTNYPIDFPPGNPGLKRAAARQHPIGFPTDPAKRYYWEVVNNNIIIWNNAKDTKLYEGKVSEDGSTIIINSPFKFFNLGPPLYYSVCNISRVLIRIGSIPTQ
jgi:hypothetical protein